MRADARSRPERLEFGPLLRCERITPELLEPLPLLQNRLPLGLRDERGVLDGTVTGDHRRVGVRGRDSRGLCMDELEGRFATGNRGQAVSPTTATADG